MKRSFVATAVAILATSLFLANPAEATNYKAADAHYKAAHASNPVVQHSNY